MSSNKYQMLDTFTLCGVCLCWATSLEAAAAPTTPQTAFFRANTLYTQGQYAKAIEAYEAVLQSGLVSGNLYFNLGNSYFKAGQVGRAILNYERARRPSSPATRTWKPTCASPTHSRASKSASPPSGNASSFQLPRESRRTDWCGSPVRLIPYSSWFLPRTVCGRVGPSGSSPWAGELLPAWW